MTVVNNETVTPEMLQPATPSASEQEAVTPVPAAEVADPAADESADQQTSESDVDEIDEEQPETKPKRDRFSERIKEVIAERNQERAELQKERAERQKLMQQLAEMYKPKQDVPQTPIDTGAPPQLESFQKYEDYLDAKADWTVTQRIKAMQTEQLKQQQAYQHQQMVNEQHKQLLDQQAKLKSITADAEKTYPDFYEKVFDESVNIPTIVAQALLESDKGKDVMYYLATNKAEADRIAKLSPSRQLVEIGKLESKDLQTIQKSKAPAPIAPVGGRKATASDSPRDTDDMETWAKKEQARLKTSR